MTAADLAAYVGQRGMLRVATGSDHLDIPVMILDAREAYGRVDVLITSDPGDPSWGDWKPSESRSWVSADRVKVRKGK